MEQEVWKNRFKDRLKMRYNKAAESHAKKIYWDDFDMSSEDPEECADEEFWDTTSF